MTTDQSELEEFEQADVEEPVWTEEKFVNLMESMRNGLYKKKDFYGQGNQIVKMGELFANEFITNQEKMDRLELSEKELGKHGLQKGDLLFARRSYVREGSGKCSIVDDLKEPLVPESSIIRARPDREHILPKFVYYFFKSSLGRNEMSKIVRQTAVSGIAQSDLKEIDIPVPPRNTQKNIVKCLNYLDQKIAVNRRIIEILEEISQVLYENWFVDFDPYSNFKNSELGKIPEGFEVKNLVDISEVTYGYSFSSDEFNEEGDGMPIIRIRNLPDNETDQFSPEGFKEKYLVEAGDVLAGMDGEFRPYIWKGPQAGLNQRVCKFEGVKPQYSSIYLWNVVRKPLFQLEQAKTGTTVIHLGKGDIDQIQIPVPDEKSLEEFNKILNSAYEEMINREKEKKNLERIRDTLLPKLMSGEVRVNDINIEDLEVSSEV